MYKIPKTDNVQDIIANLNGVQKGISTALSSVAGQMTLEAEKLAELQKQINEKKQSLQKLYDIALENGILEDLVKEYEEKEKIFQQENKKMQDDYQQALQGKQKNWIKEQQIHELKNSTEHEHLDKEHNRNIKEYEYELKLARNQENDAYQQKKNAIQQTLADIREQKEEEWAALEKQVKDKEDELEKYKKEFDEIPTKLDKESKKADYEGKAIIEKDAKIKSDLLAKEVQNAQKMFEMRVLSLDTNIKNQENRIQNLNKQLETALKQVQDLALKALEGAANQKSFDTVREIAIEQAKNQPKNK